MKKRLLLGLLLAGLILSGCAKKESSSGDKILRIAKDTNINTLDTNLATDGLSFEVIEAFTDGLLDYDANGSIVNRLAESYDVSDDGKVYTFKLRKDAKWSNGDAVTANDFVFSWRRLADPATASEYNYMITTADIVNGAEVLDGSKAPEELGVKALDDYTLEVSLNNAVPYFAQLMTFPTFNPLNEAFVESKGDQYALSVDNLLSNGPFILTDWVEGSSWTLKKNEDYYDADSVKIDGLEYTVSSDYQNSVLQFENGNLDVTKISSSLVDQYKNKDVYKQVEIGYVWYMSFNNEKVPELQNANLRLAIAHAIDRDNITQTIMKDGSRSATYIIPWGLASEGGEDFREGVDEYLAYDVAVAKEYLEKAKQELGVTSFSFEFLIEDSQEAKTNAAQIQADLAEIGVDLQIVTVPKKERLARMRKDSKDYQIGLTRWGPDYSDPYTYLGDNLGPANDYRVAYWNNAEYNELVSEIAPGGSLALDEAARWDAMHKAEEVLLSEAIIAPVWQSGEAMLISTKVQGIEMHVVGATSYRNVTISD